MNYTKDKTAEELYRGSIWYEKGVRFEDLPFYRQELWRQSARQRKIARKIFGFQSS